MPDSHLIYHIAVIAAAISAILLAVLIYRYAPRQRENRVLAGLLAGIGLWSTAQVLLAFNVMVLAAIAKPVLTLMPLLGAAFFHLALTQSTRPIPHLGKVVYAVSGFISLVAVIACAGEIKRWLGFSLYYSVERELWLPMLTLILLGGAMWLLWDSRHSANMARNRRIHAVLGVGGLGMVGFLGFLFASVRVGVFPFLALLWPLFPVFLTYAWFRYQFPEVNRWAVRTVAWTVMVAGGVVVHSLIYAALALAGIELHVAWALIVIPAVAVGLSFVALEPVEQWSKRLVYIKRPLSDVEVRAWTARIGKTRDIESLRHEAQTILSEYLGQFVGVQIAGFQAFNVISYPRLSFRYHRKGWDYRLEGWEFANPAYTHGGEDLAGLVVTKLNDLYPEGSRPLSEAGLSVPPEPEKTKPVESKPVESKPAESKPVASKPVESETATVEPTPVKSVALKSVQQMFNDAELMMQRLKAGEGADNDAIASVGQLEAIDLEPFQLEPEFDIADLKVSELFDTIKKEFKFSNVNFRQADSESIPVDANELSHALSELIQFFTPNPVEVGAWKQDDHVSLHVSSEAAEDLYHNEQEQRKHLLGLLTLYYTVGYHDGSVTYQTTDGKSEVEIRLPTGKSDKETGVENAVST